MATPTPQLGKTGKVWSPGTPADAPKLEKITVSPTVTDNEASLVRPNSAVTAAPKVSMQSQVLKNLDATLGGTVGAVQGQSMDAQLEYHLSRRASVRGIYEQSNMGIEVTDTQNSYGADFRFRWEFK